MHNCASMQIGRPQRIAGARSQYSIEPAHSDAPIWPVPVAKYRQVVPSPNGCFCRCGTGAHSSGRNCHPVTSRNQRAPAIAEKALARDHPRTIEVRDSSVLCLASISGWRSKVSKGAIVAETMPGSAAEALKVQPRDWIVKYDGALVRDFKHPVELTGAPEGQSEVAIELIRNKHQRQCFRY